MWLPSVLVANVPNMSFRAFDCLQSDISDEEFNAMFGSGPHANPADDTSSEEGEFTRDEIREVGQCASRA